MTTIQTLSDAIRDAWASVPAPPVEDMKYVPWGWGERAARSHERLTFAVRIGYVLAGTSPSPKTHSQNPFTEVSMAPPELPSRQILDALPGRALKFLSTVSKSKVIHAALAERGYTAADHRLGLAPASLRLQQPQRGHLRGRPRRPPRHSRALSAARPRPLFLTGRALAIGSA